LLWLMISSPRDPSAKIQFCRGIAGATDHQPKQTGKNKNLIEIPL